jgi:hypothetical protein
MTERKSFLLRLPADVLEGMQRWARDDLRSLNAQIEFVLREGLRQQNRAREREEHGPTKRGKRAGAAKEAASPGAAAKSVGGRAPAEPRSAGGEAPIACPNPRAPWRKDPPAGAKPDGPAQADGPGMGSTPAGEPSASAASETQKPASAAGPAKTTGSTRSPYVGKPTKEEILREWANPVPWLMRDRQRIEDEERARQEGQEGGGEGSSRDGI